jgi:signal transduction histidine kinase
LDLSKLEKKQRQIDLKTGTFEDVIHEVEEVMQEKFRQEGFTLKVGQKKIQPFQYDREVMIQVLINLIENSMKFGKTSQKKEITIRLGRDGDWMKIYVSDLGPGIPHQALKKVFDEFYRVDSRLTRTTRGTGIGLALVKKFVNLMGGTVKAANNDGAGCTITISLPLSPG